MYRKLIALVAISLVLIGIGGTLYELFIAEMMNKTWLVIYIAMIALPSFFYNDNVRIATQAIQEYVLQQDDNKRKEAAKRQYEQLRERLNELETKIK
jgi:hypothetical protein